MLIELKKGCKKSEQEYEVRVKTRNEELNAIQETIKILSEDDARDLFSKTVGFLQLGSYQHLQVGNAERQAMKQAMGRVLRVAREKKDWVLMSLAIRTKLDAAGLLPLEHVEGLGDALVRREGRDVGEDGLEALRHIVQAGLVGQGLREQRLEGGWLDRVGDGVHGSGHRVGVLCGCLSTVWPSLVVDLGGVQDNVALEHGGGLDVL